MFSFDYSLLSSETIFEGPFLSIIIQLNTFQQNMDAFPEMQYKYSGNCGFSFFKKAVDPETIIWVSSGFAYQ